MKRLSIIIIGLYLVGYLALRLTSTEVWEADGKSYVVFPERPIALYYIYRPLTYIDAALTGINFHIGPHRR